jgi:hypothetical protein
LKSDRVDEILAETNRCWIQVGRLLGVPNLTHEQGIELLRIVLKRGGPLLAEIIWGHVGEALPAAFRKYLTAGDQLDEELKKISTLPKWRAILESENIKPTDFQELVSAIRGALPALKKGMQESTQLLPGKTVGRKPKLSPEQKQEICETIKKRRGPGVKLKDLFEALAPLYDVEPITIKRAWLECEANEGTGS